MIALLSICTIFLTCCAGHAIIYRKSAYSDLEDSVISSASISPNSALLCATDSTLLRRLFHGETHSNNLIRSSLFDAVLTNSGQYLMDHPCSLIILHATLSKDNWNQVSEFLSFFEYFLHFYFTNCKLLYIQYSVFIIITYKRERIRN